jgi:hypothetical protein
MGVKQKRECLEPAQMIFLRPLLGHIKLDRQRNVDIRERLRVQSKVEEIQIYQRKWKEHVERMQDETPPKLPLKYQPVGKRNRGIPKRDGKTNSWKRVEEYRLNTPIS